MDEKGKTAYASLPGVPYEMRNLIIKSVLPKIIEDYERPHIVHKTIMTYGMGESAVAEKLEDWENNLPSFIKFAYLPNLGSVRLRLSAKGTDKEALMAGIEEQVKKLYPLIGDIIYGEEEEDGRVEKQIGTLLTDKK